MIRALIFTLIFLSIGLNSFSQKPKNGVYELKFFDLEYNSFVGTCKLILNKDSATVYAGKDLNRTGGPLIEKGILKKDKSGNWIVYVAENIDDPPSKIDFKKKIYYSF